MLYRKFNADELFTGTEMLDRNHVLVTDEKGVVQEIVTVQEAGGGVEVFNGILTPGFINCHCHLELSHMKGLIPEGTGLVDFVFKVVSQRHFPDEAIMQAIETAEEEMITNGIVAVGDICNTILTIPQKTRQRLLYHNFIEASGWLPAVAETRFQRARENHGQFISANISPRDKSTIVPHAPYSVSDVLWSAITPSFDGDVVTIHNQETIHEDAFFESGTGDFVRMYNLMKMDTSFYNPTGKTSLRSYFKRLNKARSVLLVHNSYTTPADIRYGMEEAEKVGQPLSWCICINANKYIEERVPPVDELRRQGASIVLGTDSLASNHSLNLLDEMRTIQQNFPRVGLSEMLQWATFNGAKALELEGRGGSFDKGKQPGINLISNITNGAVGPNASIKKIL